MCKNFVVRHNTIAIKPIHFTFLKLAIAISKNGFSLLVFHITIYLDPKMLAAIPTLQVT